MFIEANLLIAHQQTAAEQVPKHASKRPAKLALDASALDTPSSHGFPRGSDQTDDSAENVRGRRNDLTLVQGAAEAWRSRWRGRQAFSGPTKHSTHRSRYTVGSGSRFGRDRDNAPAEAAEASRATLSQDWWADRNSPQGNPRLDHAISDQLSSQTRYRGSSRAMRSRDWRTDLASDRIESRTTPAEASESGSRDGSRSQRLHGAGQHDSDRRLSQAELSLNWRERPEVSPDRNSPGIENGRTLPIRLSKMGRPIASFAGMSTLFPLKSVFLWKGAGCAGKPLAWRIEC